MMLLMCTMVLLWGVGCGLDDVTTERTFAGRILDAGGQPVPGLVVQSLEAQARTDETGLVRISRKPDTNLVHFTSKGTWYRYSVTPSDAGQVVELRLPTVREATLACPQVPCDLTLRWPLSEALEAQVRPRCAPGTEVALKGVPDATPEPRCAVGKGLSRELVPVRIQASDGRWEVVEARASVVVELKPIEGELPEGCRVHVGDQVARPGEPGTSRFTASVSLDGGPLTVGAQCGDRPARPVQVERAALAEPITLEWSPTGPTLDLEAVAPWAEEVVVAAPVGWTLRRAPDESGVVQLPPLSPAEYRVLVRAADKELPLVAAPPEAAPGLLVLEEVGEGQIVGVLAVDADLEGGAVKVIVAP